MDHSRLDVASFWDSLSLLSLPLSLSLSPLGQHSVVFFAFLFFTLYPGTHRWPYDERKICRLAQRCLSRSLPPAGVPARICMCVCVCVCLWYQPSLRHLASALPFNICDLLRRAAPAEKATTTAITVQKAKHLLSLNTNKQGILYTHPRRPGF